MLYLREQMPICRIGWRLIRKRFIKYQLLIDIESGGLNLKHGGLSWMWMQQLIANQSRWDLGGLSEMRVITSLLQWGSHGKVILVPRRQKLFTVKEALSWLKIHNLENIRIEIESLVVVQGLQSPLKDSSFDIILYDVKDILRHFCHAKISFVKRCRSRCCSGRRF